MCHCTFYKKILYLIDILQGVSILFNQTYPEVPRMSSTTDVNRQKLIPFPDVTSISGRSMTVYGTRSLTASNPKVTPVPAVAAPSSGDELKNKMVRVKIRRRRSSNKVKVSDS